MVWPLIGYVVAGLLGVATVVAIITFWDKVRDTVANWLRQKGLENNIFMDAWIKLDSIISGVKGKIFVKTQRIGQVKISEETYALDEIDDPEVHAELEKKGYVNRNIMNYLQ